MYFVCVALYFEKIETIFLSGVLARSLRAMCKTKNLIYT